ncbi:hypothetical protein LXL04_011440 [Taraxacum kok-saghyz]
MGVIEIRVLSEFNQTKIPSQTNRQKGCALTTLTPISTSNRFSQSCFPSFPSSLEQHLRPPPSSSRRHSSPVDAANSSPPSTHKFWQPNVQQDSITAQFNYNNIQLQQNSITFLSITTNQTGHKAFETLRMV